MLVLLFWIWILSEGENVTQKRGKKILILLLTLLLPMLLQAAGGVGKLLYQYQAHNDPSEKTIDQNRGHLVLFTREKLERMHAESLKDVFKTLPVIYYHENRYALPDPLSGYSPRPYLSNFIRLYIDGVEITHGWMGSALVLYGDMNIDFVDHIECYYAIPSFETSVEPAYLTIFIYSKAAEQDSGTQLRVRAGSRGYHSESLEHVGSLGQSAYMLHLSHTDAKRQKIANGTAHPLSRDFERLQLFGALKSENQSAHLQIMRKRMDTLAGLSYDATPLVSRADVFNLHLDYRIDFDPHWFAQFSYDWMRSDLKQADDFPLIYLGATLGNRLDAIVKNDTYTAELSYKERLGRHRLMAGIKARHKRLHDIALSGTADIPPDFSRESIFSAFVQDQYLLSKEQIITAGIEYSRIARDASVADDNLLQLRLGYLYSSAHWSYKAYLYRTMFALDPLSRTIDLPALSRVTPQKTYGVTQELAYSDRSYRLRLMMLMMRDEDGLLKNGAAAKTRYFFNVLNYDYLFDPDNALHLQLYYARYKDIFNLSLLEDYSGYMSLENSYKELSFYNGIVWHQNSIDHKNYFDLTSSISWDIDNDTTLTLKGDNLLNKAKATRMFRLDPATGNLLPPLSVSPIDRRITLKLEYTF
jgi:iron complex outermembrane receptor protein